MSNTASLQVVTANRLADGAVVYRAESGRWTRSIGEAASAADASAAADLLALAERDVARALIVAPYLIEVGQAVSGLVPLSLRERIRAAGPSIETSTA